MGLARSPRIAKLTANMTLTVTKFIRILMVTKSDETRPVEVNHHLVPDAVAASQRSCDKQQQLYKKLQCQQQMKRIEDR